MKLFALVISMSFSVFAAEDCSYLFNKLAGTGYENSNLAKGPLDKNDLLIFSKIKREEFKTVPHLVLKNYEKKMNELIESTEEATYENTIEAMFKIEEHAIYMKYVIENYAIMVSDEKIITPLYSKYSSDFDKVKGEFFFNEKLFKKVKKIYESNEELTTLEKGKLLKVYKKFVDNGISFPKDIQKKILNLNQDLTIAQNEFVDNVTKTLKKLKIIVRNKKYLDGLSQSTLEKIGADKFMKGETNSLTISLAGPSLYSDILSSSNSRNFRKRLVKKRSSLGLSGEFDNTELVKKILKIRKNLADLYDKKNYSEVVLENTLAKNPANVKEFLEYNLDKASIFAKKERELVEAFARKSGFEGKFEAWDYGYYFKKYMAETYSFDENIIKEYFVLDNVLNDGVLKTIKKLHNVEFEKIEGVSTWNKDVQTYAVKNLNGEIISYIYFDFYIRPGTKYSGAWKHELYPPYKKDGSVIPIITVNQNLSKPKSGKTLMSIREVKTLFHEMGHAMDAVFMKGDVEIVRETSRDFVELPSQFMENYFYFSDEVIKGFARHYKTGEVISDDLITKIKEDTYQMSMGGFFRQLKLAYTDFMYHTTNPNEIKDLKEFEFNSISKWMSKDSTLENFSAMAGNFSHIFGGGYTSQYYAYAWSEMYSTYIWEMFKKEGIFNQDIAQRFREFILGDAGVVGEGISFDKFSKGQKPPKDLLLDYYSGKLQD